MSDIKPNKPIDVTKVLGDLSLLKHHPSGIVDYCRDLQADITEGRVEYLEPNNPSMYNIEQAGLIGGFVTQEFILESRKLMPILANNEETLYRHMSDEDFLNRFSSPASAKVMLNIMYNEFLTKAYEDPITFDRIFKIPRYFKITVGDTIYTTMAPIIIRRTKAGVVDVRFEGGMNDKIFPVSQGYIHYDVIEERGTEDNNKQLSIASGQGERYLTFELDLPEIEVTAQNRVIEQSAPMSHDIKFNNDRMFYYIRVFHSEDKVDWKEMSVTHTQEVWEIGTPTCIVSVLQEKGLVKCFIPPEYLHTGRIKGHLKFVIYTTKGPINLDYGIFNVETDYKCEYSEIFSATEMDETTLALATLMPYPFIRGRVIGGRPAKTFAQLKYDFINNNLIPNIPVTPVNIDNVLRGTDLTPITNHDVVTSREQLVKTKIPSSITKYGITRMSLDMIEYKTSLDALKGGKNGVVVVNDEVVVIPQHTIFKSDSEGSLSILTKHEANNLRALSGQPLVNELNRNNYMGLYYHYVLDTSGPTTQLRSYDLGQPRVVSSIFKDYNNTIGLAASTTNNLIKMTKVPTGYKIDFMVAVTSFNKMYDVYNITPCLVYTTDNGTRYFIEGKLYLDSEDRPIFTCYIDSDGYITDSDRIIVHNFKDSNGHTISIDIGLTQALDLIFFTNSYPPEFKPKDMDSILYGTYLAGNNAVITLETHNVEFGLRLKRLYSRVHTSTGKGEYQRHTEPVYKTYKHVVFDENYEIKHHPGDFILDEKGEKMILFNVGDIVLDENMKPKLIGVEDLARYLNLLLIDYKAIVADGSLTTQYKDHVRQTINTLVLNNMVDYNKDVYNRTEAYLTVPNGLTNITASSDGKYGVMQSSQSFKFFVHVNKRVYDDMTTRRSIEEIIKETLDGYLTGNTRLSKVTLLESIFKRIKPFTLSIRLDKLTELDGEYIRIDSNNAEISIRKKLKVTPEGYDVVDDVNFIFMLEEE